jgi:transposase-like protein
MNPHQVFCPNIECPARGRQGEGNIGIHSQPEGRYICHECQRTFSTRKGTLFYRLRSDAATVVQVITLMAYGCPLPAIVKAFGLDARTVKLWWQRSGEHCRGVHEHLVEGHPMDLQQVQADELKAKTQGGSVWIAMAMMVSTRLWLGGVVSATRNYDLIEQLVSKVRGIALCRPLLLAVDGLVSYVGAFQAAFRSPLPRHRRPGRPKLVAWQNISIVQVVKRRTAKSLEIARRIVQGSEAQVCALLQRSQGGGTINTAYIERLNGSFRQRLASLARRTRCLAQQATTLHAGMYIVGCFYNLCDEHTSLRLRLWITERRYHWVQRTPAMTAALTDHCWTPIELFSFKVPPPPWSPPKCRGRPSNLTRQLVARWCS